MDLELILGKLILEGSDEGVQLLGLLSFGVFSNIRYSKNHNVSETGSIPVLRLKGGRHIFCQVH
jgi:hypothetical protein